MTRNLLQKSKVMEKNKKEKSPEGRFKRNERVQKNYEISKVAAAAAAAAMQVDELEDTDFGGGYSDQSSHGYEGVVVHESPPTPEMKKKHERTLPTRKQKRISGAGGGKKDDLSSSSSERHPSPPPEVKKNLPDCPPAVVKNILLSKTSASGGAKKDDDSTSSERSVSLDHFCDPEWKLKGKKNVDVGGRKNGPDLRPVMKPPQRDPKIFYPNPINRGESAKKPPEEQPTPKNMECPKKVQVWMRFQKVKEENHLLKRKSPRQKM